MNTKYKAVFALAFLLLVYTLYTILLQVGGSTIGLIPQLFYAFLVGFAISSIVSFTMDRGKGLVSIVSSPKLLLAILVVGLINNALAQLSLGIGTLGTNPSIGGIIYRSWVLIVLLLTPLVLKQKVKKMQVLATLIGFVGLYLVISGGTLFSFDPSQAPFMGFLLISALCSVVVTLIMSRYTFNVYGAAVLFNFVSFLALALLATSTHTALIVNFTLPTTFSILFLGIFGFGLGTSLYYYTIKILGPQFVGNTILSIPFLTIFLSTILIGTPFKAYYIVAALLISTSVLLQRHYSSRPERITEKSALSQLQIFDVTGAFANNSSYVISNHIAGGNRAFAIKLNSKFDETLHSSIFLKNQCMAFTNINPHDGTKPEEIEFINDVMGLKEGDMALIGIGDPKSLEASFEEFVTV